MEVVAIKIDELLLNGQGSNSEPLGILNTPGIGAVTFGATPTYVKLIAFETALASLNADRGRMSYISTPATRGSLKTVALLLTGATTVAARPLWEDGNSNDGTNDGLIGGHRAAATLQMPNNLVLFGNFEDLVCGMWAGLDLVVDVFTKAKNAEVVLTINMWIDAALRHPQSFCLSSDSGAQ